MNNNNDLKKKEFKQLIILVVVFIILLLAGFLIEKYFIPSLSDNTTTEETTTEEAESETESMNTNAYKINGMTKEEWEEIKSYTDETVYNTIMEIFENESNFEESYEITVDTDAILEEANNEQISDEEQAELDAETLQDAADFGF